LDDDNVGSSLSGNNTNYSCLCLFLYSFYGSS